mmetsp:Transcript_24773/g.57498  ORF Transcript_24773/g.57498 Transcript_24773/m.57498 type:complete len:777 (-) Transcript_24773:174-2504(-)
MAVKKDDAATLGFGSSVQRSTSLPSLHGPRTKLVTNRLAMTGSLSYVSRARRSSLQKWQLERRSATMLEECPGADMQCSLPEDVVRQLREKMSGHQWLCVVEKCHGCEDHQMTTKHDEGKYQRIASEVFEWVAAEFGSCIACTTVDALCEHTSRGVQPRRIGAFEVYLIRQSFESSEVSSQQVLVHSKLLTLQWPQKSKLMKKVLESLPDKLRGLKDPATWPRVEKDAEEVLRLVKEWGLQEWTAAKKATTWCHKFLRLHGLLKGDWPSSLPEAEEGLQLVAYVQAQPFEVFDPEALARFATHCQIVEKFWRTQPEPRQWPATFQAAEQLLRVEKWVSKWANAGRLLRHCHVVMKFWTTQPDRSVWPASRSEAEELLQVEEQVRTEAHAGKLLEHCHIVINFWTTQEGSPSSWPADYDSAEQLRRVKPQVQIWENASELLTHCEIICRFWNRQRSKWPSVTCFDAQDVEDARIFLQKETWLIDIPEAREFLDHCRLLEIWRSQQEVRLHHLLDNSSSKENWEEATRLVEKLHGDGFEVSTAAKVRILIALQVDSTSKHLGKAFGKVVLDADVSIVFLLDQSGSVTQDVFDKQLKKAAVQLTEQIVQQRPDQSGSTLQFAGVAFSKEIEMFSDLTTNPADFKSSIRQHEYKGGGTYTDEALFKARDILQRTPNDAVRLVFNFTDGDPNKGHYEPAIAARQDLERESKAAVVGIGIGGKLDMNKLQQISSAGLAIPVKDFAELRGAIQGAFNAITEAKKRGEKLSTKDLLDHMRGAVP